MLAKTGKKLRKEPSKWQPGKFYHPHDACFDQGGYPYSILHGSVALLRWFNLFRQSIQLYPGDSQITARSILRSYPKYGTTKRRCSVG